MEATQGRKIKFKAWNASARLLMRLDNIECYKGELIKKDHVLLQFTGLVDKEGDEIYDRDILLSGYVKFIVYWNDVANGWYFRPYPAGSEAPFVTGIPGNMKRFCSFFELQE